MGAPPDSRTDMHVLETNPLDVFDPAPGRSTVGSWMRNPHWFESASIVRPEGLLTLLAVSRLDEQTANAFRRRVDDEIVSGRRVIIADLSNVAHLGSAGLGALISAYRKLERVHGVLVVCSATDEVQTLFEISRAAQLLVIEPDLVSAFAWLREHGR